MPSFDFGVEGIHKNTSRPVIKHPHRHHNKFKHNKSPTEISVRDTEKYVELAKKAEAAAAKLSNVDQQITILTKALDSLPQYLNNSAADQTRFSLLVRRGFANLKNKALVSAKKDATEANRIQPRHYDVLMLMANIYERAGKRDQAKQCYLSAAKFLTIARSGKLTARDQKRITEWESKATRMDWIDPFGKDSKLPIEIKLEIIGHLDFRSKVSFQRVSTNWQELFKHPSLWYHLDFAPHRQGIAQITSGISPRSVNTSIARAQGQVRTLILPSTNWEYTPTGTIVSRLVTHNATNLRVLDINLAYTNLTFLTNAMNNISRFVNLSVLHVVVMHGFSTTIGSFPALRELNVLFVRPSDWVTHSVRQDVTALPLGKLPSTLAKLHIHAQPITTLPDPWKFAVPVLDWSGPPTNLIDVRFENCHADNNFSIGILNRLLDTATSLQKFTYIGGKLDGLLHPFPNSIVELDLQPIKTNVDFPIVKWSNARLYNLQKLTVNGGSHRVPSVLTTQIFEILHQAAVANKAALAFKDLTILETWTTVSFRDMVNDLLRAKGPDLKQLTVSYDSLEESDIPWTAYVNLESLTLFDADLPGVQVAEIIRGLGRLSLKRLRLEGNTRLSDVEEYKEFASRHGVDLELPKPSEGKNGKRIYN